MNNSSSFPKLDISQLLSCKVICPKHPQGVVESICSSPSCEKSKMICGICKAQDPEHTKSHSNYFKRPEDLQKTLQNENDEFHKLVSESIISASSNLKENLDSLMTKEVERLDKFFEELNRRLKEEMENIKTEVFSMVMKKFFAETLEDFDEFYSSKFATFTQQIINPFLQYSKIASNKAPIRFYFCLNFFSLRSFLFFLNFFWFFFVFVKKFQNSLK